MPISKPDSSSPPRPLTLDPKFQPCDPPFGDEYCPNGIFEFIVTRMRAHLEAHTDQFPVQRVKVAALAQYAESRRLNEETILAADLFHPLVLAEIRSGLYERYVGYWNEKVEQFQRSERRRAFFWDPA